MNLRIKKFPIELQLESKDCGPTCLKMTARYFGKYYSLQYLRDLCGSSREGVSFYDISYAAEKIGLKTLAFKSNITTLQKEVQLPVIIHWQKNHLVVIYKIKKNKVFIADPAKGKITHSIADTEKNWFSENENFGYVLAIEPSSDFNKINENEKLEQQKSWTNILSYFKAYKSGFINIAIVMLIVTVLQAFLPFISKAVIDVGIQTQDLSFINMVLIGNIVIILSITLSNIVRDWLFLHIASRINITLVSDYIAKILRLPITFFENKLAGDILQRASDLERIRSFLMNNSISVFFSLLTLFIFSIILCYFNVTVFLIFLIGNCFYFGWISLFLQFRKKVDWELFDILSKNQSLLIETINTAQDIKLNNYETKKRWIWEGLQAKLFKVNTKVQSIDSSQNIGAQTINSLTTLIITFACAKNVILGNMTFGMMISTQFILGMLNGPIYQFVSFIQSYQYAKISFLRLNEIQVLKDEEDEVALNSTLLPNNKNLTLRNVSFQYSPSSDLSLKSINLYIPEGKVTAIVGDSGSGKSTLLKLLLRLYNPSYGEIFVGNMNIKNINLRQWRKSCGAVMQDGKIFNDTILKNITLDDENINYDFLRECVSVANINKEIEALPLGYNTQMGEQGRGLSGGQKQRILIARALYKNPDYLFFDEATNALDTVNEKKIVDALENIFKEKTVIVVAHRLSTIRNADQIVVLKQGFIVEVGTHIQLIEKKGYYNELIKAQFENLS